LSNGKQFAKKLTRKALAYRRTFLGDDGKPTTDGTVMLADLKAFCYADKSTTKVSPVSKMVDPIASAQAEGRREVWLRITQILYLDDRIIQAINDLEDIP